MKSKLSLFLPLLLSSVSAHQFFAELLVNDTLTNKWQYVRDVSTDPANGIFPGNPDMWKTDPQYPDALLNEHHRCGRNGSRPSPSTQTADVLAGSQVGFRVNNAFTSNHAPFFVHEGPGFIYLAKKPEGVTLSDWDGNGDWFKIAYSGPINDTMWTLYHGIDYNFTIPKTTPPGEYLMRIESFWPRPKDESQFYVNCAQINIIGPGGGTPKGFARFPGTYKVDDPGIRVKDGEEYYVDDSSGGRYLWHSGFMKYTAPGPAVWKG